MSANELNVAPETMDLLLKASDRLGIPPEQIVYHAVNLWLDEKLREIKWQKEEAAKLLASDN